MSIWASVEDIGETERGRFTGSVLAYIQGWSNHYPTSSTNRRINKRHLKASVDTAWLPPYCVPGNRSLAETGEDIGDCVGPWLRLGVRVREVSVWTEEPTIGELDWHAVCLNEDAVKALRDNLNEWLERDKVYPQEAM